MLSLRSLCVLCASAVNLSAKQVNRRDAEDAENRAEKSEITITD